MELVRTQIHELTLDTKVECVKCKKTVPLHLTCADTEGRAFQDYYCFNCVKSLKGGGQYDNIKT